MTGVSRRCGRRSARLTPSSRSTGGRPGPGRVSTSPGSGTTSHGRKAGNDLTKLLREHILGAVALLQAAKSSDQAAIKSASDAW